MRRERDEGYENEERVSVATDVREALILAGIAEIESHGLGDFSLRRVATACGVSCAAPYKHFKGKEDLIREILRYIHGKWELLETHICAVCTGGDKRTLVELCLADIRFWIGNPHFRSVHTMETTEIEGGKTRLGRCAEEVLAAVAARQTEEEARRLTFTVRSLVYGAILMLEDGTLENSPASFRMLRETLESVIPDEK